MKREKIKVPRGTARRLRRADMSIFRAEREKRREAASAGTHTFNQAARGAHPTERNPNGHSVATVTDMRNGEYVVRQYDWSSTYPANVPCPHRNEIAAPRHFRTYGAAKELSDAINRIEAPAPKPLRWSLHT